MLITKVEAMVKDTSLQAYISVYSNGKAEHIRFKVYNFIKSNPKVTRQQITDLAGIPINVVTPRVKELIESNLIKENGKTDNKYMLEVM